MNETPPTFLSDRELNDEIERLRSDLHDLVAERQARVKQRADAAKAQRFQERVKRYGRLATALRLHRAGMTYREIGRVFGLSAGRVQQLVWAAEHPDSWTRRRARELGIEH